MENVNSRVDWKLGFKVLGGFAIVFLAIWIVQHILGVGPNLIRKIK